MRVPTGSSAAVRDGSRDAMTVSVTSDADPAAHAELVRRVEQRLKDRLGVSIAVEVVAPGALDGWTEVGTAPKLKRFRDDR